MCWLSRNPGALTSRTPQGHVGLFRGSFTFYYFFYIFWTIAFWRANRSITLSTANNLNHSQNLFSKLHYRTHLYLPVSSQDKDLLNILKLCITLLTIWWPCCWFWFHSTLSHFDFYQVSTMATHIFQKSWWHLKILDARWVKRQKFQIEDQQIVGATKQNCHHSNLVPRICASQVYTISQPPRRAIFFC
jgi:hypothetical protein